MLLDPQSQFRVGTRHNLLKPFFGADTSQALVNIVPPSLTGLAQINRSLILKYGIWGGPGPITFDLQWLRNGADIAGATSHIYVNTVADDLKNISCRVTADNGVDTIVLTTDSVLVTHIAPVPAETLPDLYAVQNNGDIQISLAGLTDSLAVTWSTSGGGSLITGTGSDVLTLLTDVARDGETVTVTATNTGGTLDFSFSYTCAVQEPWKPVPFRSPVELTEDANHPELWNMGFGSIGGDPTKGLLGAADLQWGHGYASAQSAPWIVVKSQDIDHPRISFTGGTKWRSVDGYGLQQVGGNTIIFDPQDANVLFLVATPTYVGSLGTPQSNALNALGGLWRSSDCGASWSPVLTGFEISARQRYVQTLIAHKPLSSGETTATRTWFWLMAECAVEGGDITGLALYEGVNGGVTGDDWTVKNTFTPAVFGKVAALVQHPTEPNTMFICSENGLWRTQTAAAATPTWGRPFAALGSDGDQINSLLIDPSNPDVMFVGSTNADILLSYTTNGGETWTKVNPASTYPICNIAMSAEEGGERIIYAHSPDTAVLRAKWATWDTSSKAFTTSWVNTNTPNAGHPESNYSKTTGQGVAGYGGLSFTLPHPTIKDEILLTGRHHFFRTTTGPLGFIDANAGLIGLSGRDIDVYNGLTHIAAADVAWYVSEDGMLSWGREIDSVEIGRPEAISEQYGAPVPWSGLAVHVLRGGSNDGRVMISVGGNLTILQFLDIATGAWGHYYTTGYNPGGPLPRAYYPVIDNDGDYVYAGSVISSDGADTWDDLSKRFIGMSQQTGSTIFGWSKSGSTHSIFRSTDRGSNWGTAVHTTTAAIEDSKGRISFWLDPTKDTRFYTVDSSGALVMIDGADPAVDTNLAFPFAGVYLTIYSVVVDSNDPHYFLVLCEAYGNQSIQMGLWDAGFNTVTWSDYTQNGGRSAYNGALRLYPPTREVVQMTPHGVQMRPALDGVVETGAIYPNLPKPIQRGRNGWPARFTPGGNNAPGANGNVGFVRGNYGATSVDTFLGAKLQSAYINWATLKLIVLFTGNIKVSLDGVPQDTIYLEMFGVSGRIALNWVATNYQSDVTASIYATLQAAYSADPVEDVGYAFSFGVV